MRVPNPSHNHFDVWRSCCGLRGCGWAIDSVVAGNGEASQQASSRVERNADIIGLDSHLASACARKRIPRACDEVEASSVRERARANLGYSGGLRGALGGISGGNFDASTWFTRCTPSRRYWI